MMRCDECEKLLVEAYYGELDPEALAGFREHLAACERCGAAFEEIKSTLELMDGRERPDPGQAYWDGYWNRLTARMEREGAGRPGWVSRLIPRFGTGSARWAYRAAAAAMLIVFGAVVGRMVLPGPSRETRVEAPAEVTVTRDVAAGKAGETRDAAPGRPSGESAAQGVARKKQAEEKSARGAPAPPANVRLASSNACAREYLEDSKVLLLALVNFDPEVEGGYVADWSRQQRRSRELASEAASITRNLDDPSQRRLRSLVSQLELILIQIANLEVENDEDAVELIRNTVNDQNLMLKIDLERMRSDSDVECPAARPGDGA